MEADDNSTNTEDSKMLVKVKEEPNDDFKDYAETTMNELLGWYGYDKVDSQDTKSLDLARYKSENPGSDESGDDLSRGDNYSENGEPHKFCSDSFRDETSLAAQHRNLVNALKKRCSEKSNESPEEGTSSSRFIICAWCQKPGVKLFTLKTDTCTKAFCSELCFSQCRRASFKKNKMCDWCKHVRPTVNYVDFQDGDQQYQFCTEKCLNQYKMNLFCREAREHLEHIKSGEKGDSPENREKVMITPELWLKNKGKVKVEDIERKHIPRNSSHRSEKMEHRSILGSKLFHSGRDHKTSESTSREKEKPKSRTHNSNSTDSLKSPQPASVSSSGSSIFGAENMPWLLPNGQMLGPMLPPYAHLHHLMCSGLLPPHLVNLLTTGALPDLLPNPSRSSGRNVTSTPASQLNSPGSDSGVKGSHTSEAIGHQYSSARVRETQRTHSSQPLHSAFPPVNPQVSIPPDVSAYNSPIGNHFPQHDLQKLGLPPVTMMLPLPVALPVPVPIPIPIPLTMEQIKIAVNWDESKDKLNENEVSKTPSHDERVKEKRRAPSSPITPHSINTGSCVSFNSPRSEQSSPNSVLSDSISSSDKPLNLHSPRSHMEGIPLPARFRFSSRLPSTSPNEVIDLSKDSMAHLHKSENSKEERDADLSNLSNDSDKRSDSDKCDESESGKVPLIHIIPSKSEPSLANPLPLPPIEQNYSSRRGLILDAPVVPKRKRSPSPVSDRRVYSRITKDIMEAAKRRALRARLKTK